MKRKRKRGRCNMVGRDAKTLESQLSGIPVHDRVRQTEIHELCQSITGSRITENRCGDCNACCRILEVESLCKSAGPACKHLSGMGCNIYADRPDECRQFQCLWLAAMAPHEQLRPDRSGLFLYPDTNPEVGKYILCHELHDGAFGKQRQILFKLSEATGNPVVVRLFDGTFTAVYTSQEQFQRLLPVANLAQSFSQGSAGAVSAFNKTQTTSDPDADHLR